MSELFELLLYLPRFVIVSLVLALGVYLVLGESAAGVTIAIALLIGLGLDISAMKRKG